MSFSSRDNWDIFLSVSHLSSSLEKTAKIVISLLRDYSSSTVYAIIGDMSQSDQKLVEELYAVVAGYVQGVGFRYFVVEKAQRLGLHGYVRNQTNGDVEVVAQGTRPALENLLVRSEERRVGKREHR